MLGTTWITAKHAYVLYVWHKFSFSRAVFFHAVQQSFTLTLSCIKNQRWENEQCSCSAWCGNSKAWIFQFPIVLKTMVSFQQWSLSSTSDTRQEKWVSVFHTFRYQTGCSWDLPAITYSWWRPLSIFNPSEWGQVLSFSTSSPPSLPKFG